MTVSPTRTSFRCSSADEYWLQPGHRGDGPCSANLEFDVADDRKLLLGRKLVRNSPARRPGDETQFLLIVEPIHLVDDTVDIVTQRIPPPAHVCVEFQAAFDPRDDSALRTNLEAPIL